MLKEQTLNKVKVKPLIVNNQDVSMIKGNDLFPSTYYNLFICSKKKSGKTSLINTILQKCTDKRTMFFIFCSTVHVDASWKAIVEYLKNRGNTVNTYTEIMDGKVNILNEIVNELSLVEDVSVVEDKNEIPTGKILFEEPKKKKEYKPKKMSPEVVFIFDDASEMVKNASVATLLKKNRHLKSNVIISSQYLHDLSPSSIKQLDYFICFKSFSNEKLEVIHKHLDLSIDLDKLYSLYSFCTSKPYSFLYINVRTEEYRCNFNKKIEFDIE
jgi:hypothetical protein